MAQAEWYKNDEQNLYSHWTYSDSFLLIYSEADKLWYTGGATSTS